MQDIFPCPSCQQWLTAVLSPPLPNPTLDIVASHSQHLCPSTCAVVWNDLWLADGGNVWASVCLSVCPTVCELNICPSPVSMTILARVSYFRTLSRVFLIHFYTSLALTLLQLCCVSDLKVYSFGGSAYTISNIFVTHRHMYVGLNAHKNFYS